MKLLYDSSFNPYFFGFSITTTAGIIEKIGKTLFQSLFFWI